MKFCFYLWIYEYTLYLIRVHGPYKVKTHCLPVFTVPTNLAYIPDVTEITYKSEYLTIGM